MAAPIELLTPRERECLRLVHAHLNSKQIARELGIQPATVDRHCENAARKLNAIGRVDAALLLARERLPNDSVSAPSPIVSEAPLPQPDVARGGEHDPDQRPHSRHHLDPAGDRAGLIGRHAGEEGHGAPSGRGDAQAVAVSDRGGLREGDHLHWGGAAGRAIQSVGLGPEHLGRILLVLSIAAFIALVAASILGAEKVAFLLQGLRYGG